MTTKHQYVDKYPISPTSERLIIGTIHPHDHFNFSIPFFYGNKKSLWLILNKAFNGEIGSELTLNGILRFLDKRKISISDTVLECARKNPTALDKDLIPLKLNHALVSQIKNSNIKEVLFTSGFGKNNAFKLFYVDMLKQKITQDIRRNRQVILSKEIFGRPLKLKVLYSPSGSSNVPLSKTEIYLNAKDKYKTSRRPVYDFKVDYYRECFT